MEVARDVVARAEAASAEEEEEKGKSTLEVVLSALWNLSAHCGKNKVRMEWNDDELGKIVFKMAISVPACNLFDGRGSPVPRGAVQSPQLGHCREQQRDPEKLVELHCSVRRSGKIQVRARYKIIL